MKVEKKKPFPVVAIGASAGGLEAVTELLQNLPKDTGMAYFYVQHLSPEHPSSLAAILSRDAKIIVKDATDMMPVDPDHLYVCVPNKEMVVANGKIELHPRDDSQLPYLPIDDFFCGLALEFKEDVTGIVLSGNASDGTRGLTAIKDAGGTTFAQDNSAKYSSMPVTAIDAHVVDFILSPREIARELGKMNKKGYIKLGIDEAEKTSEIDDSDPDFKTILGILHKNTRVDFSHYKMNTINRRLHHRMSKCGVKSVKSYLELLNSNPDEVDVLYKDLLINVTSFFRDKEAFSCLKKVYFPQLLKSKKPGEVLRIWVTACSTGEEAYTIAMLISELQNDIPDKIQVQIFATDLSEDVITIARAGVYTEPDIAAISPSRVKKFFVKEGSNYIVIKELREMCVFATHNLLSDPPFSRMDFISCCNLLIYFDAAAQKRAIPTLHFALNDGGYLMLGKSETIGASLLLFTQVDPKFKIFCRKKDTGIRKVPELVPRFPGVTTYNNMTIKKHIYPQQFIKAKITNNNYSNLGSAIDAILLAGHMPACAVVNKEMEILQFRGSTSLYLAHPSGKASLNILKMARPEFAFELRSAISKVIKLKQPVTAQGVEMEINNVLKTVSLIVYPIEIEGDEPLLLVVFTVEDGNEKQIDAKGKGNASKRKDTRIARLTEEMNALRNEMQAIIEAQETTYEELQAANEEIVSSNEEFQTLNEELETSKEEIEASNEELIATNQELRMRNEMLVESANYSDAIMQTIHEPMIILTNDLKVKSANSSFYKTFSVKQDSTEGKSLFDLGNKQWDIPELHELLENILSNSTSFNNFKVAHTFPKIGEKVMLLNASKIEQKSQGEELILLAIEDITKLTIKQDLEKNVLYENISKGKIKNELLERAVQETVLKRTEEINLSKKILEDKNAELEIANKDLLSFTYVSSHDLQEPLREIQIFTGLIIKEEQGNLSENGINYFKKMQETARRMQTLLEDLLAYSRSKNIEHGFELTNINSIVDKVRKDFDEFVTQNDAKIEYGDLGTANVIPFQFSIIVTNLIGNAFRFADTKRPLVITLSSTIVNGSQLHTEKLSQQKNYYKLTVKDNGIGFDNIYREKIFEVFQRLHSRTDYEGTGIGLAICKRIAENHDGMITANGNLNKGAQFDVYIPLDGPAGMLTADI